MPNYCGNELTVSGPSEELRRFKKYVKNAHAAEDDQKILDFSTIIPVPQEGMSDYNLWGTRSNAWEVTIDSGRLRTGTNDTIFYTFDTAWSPPDEVIMKMIEIFPLLDFVFLYGEPGCCFSGKIEGSEGEVTFNDSGEYGEYYGESEDEEPEPEPVVLKKNKLGNFPHKKKLTVESR